MFNVGQKYLEYSMIDCKFLIHNLIHTLKQFLTSKDASSYEFFEIFKFKVFIDMLQCDNVKILKHEKHVKSLAFEKFQEHFE